jgi:hypothetical protein
MLIRSFSKAMMIKTTTSFIFAYFYREHLKLFFAIKLVNIDLILLQS